MQISNDYEVVKKQTQPFKKAEILEVEIIPQKATFNTEDFTTSEFKENLDNFDKEQLIAFTKDRRKSIAVLALKKLKILG